MRVRAIMPAVAVCCALLAPGARAESPPAPEKVVLQNGATLIVQPDPNVNTVAICCFVRAGTAEEEGRSGVAAMTARSIFGSNDNQSREAVNRDIYLAGGSLEVISEADYSLITCVTDRATFREAFYSIGQALKTALFDGETVEGVRAELLAEARTQSADPSRVAVAAANLRLYAGGPYRNTVLGPADAIQRWTSQHLLAFYRKRYTPANTVISVSGHITIEEVKRSAENQLFDYERAAARPAPRESGELPLAPSRVVRKLATRTRMIVVGFRGPGVADPDYPAWLVLNAIVGGGKSSRLFRSVRDSAGVGYSVLSRAADFARDGNLMALVEYNPSRPGGNGQPLDPAAIESSVLESIKSVVSVPPTETEVARARRFTAGKLALAHERVRDRAFYAGWYEAIGAGYELDRDLPRKIAAVTVEDVVRLARLYLKNEVVVIVEPTS